MYLVLLSVGGHGQRAVSDDVGFVLQGLEKDGGRCAPLLALDHGADGALLVGGVHHVQGLGQGATDRTDKIHHLQEKKSTRAVGSLNMSEKKEPLRGRKKVSQHLLILLMSCTQRKWWSSLSLLIAVCVYCNALVDFLSATIH